MAFISPSFSSSPLSTSKLFYHVFLSFSGIDTRDTFIAHLYPALKQMGFKTYKDDKDLERGQAISPTLLAAIEESMISIIVLSKNYALSTWCLEELTKILECRKTNQQIVLPVFYHIHPSEVQNQIESFEEMFFEDPKVQRWKESLQEVANLAGEHLKDGDESEFIHKIISSVCSTIDKTMYRQKPADHLVGLKSRIKDLNAHLRMGSINEITLMIGIYGTGGIGKTTIAKEVYNLIADQFEARCFLSNVRKLSTHDGLVKLQERLLNELLGNFRSLNVDSVGANVINLGLRSKRILLILDDVNDSLQLKELAGDHNWFGPGSRIIITTRDKHLLECHKVDSMYEVEGLDNNHAIQLFSWHAFKKKEPDEKYVEYTQRIIGYAKGLPLALEVLGSYLYRRSIEQWESVLKKYKRKPHKHIYEVLRISYDGLDEDEKNIFLDIVCFFKGKHLQDVTRILDHCGFPATIGIQKLREKCLINIDKFDHVEMHDLLQEMGKEVVRQESITEAGRRSRLWCHKDVRHVLEEKTGSRHIEGILLDLPGRQDEICLHSEAFRKMKKLRLFINHNAQISGVPNYLPNKLGVLRWSKYPSSSLPSDFRGNKLSIFGMHHSLIEKLDGLKLKKLREMDLSYSKVLKKIPDLSSSPNLEKLNLQYCENLVEVHHKVGSLDKLSDFLVNGCSKLRILPERFELRSLRLLQLDDCPSLQDFPEIVCEMRFLHRICLKGTSITELPSSIEKLTELQYLDLNGTGIKELPSSIGKLTKLERLSAKECKDLVHLPSSIHQLHHLCSLELDHCSQAINIREVEEDGTQTTDGSQANWASLVLSLQSCRLSESNFFTNAKYFPTLFELNLSGSDIVIFPPREVIFAGLRNLYLNNCKDLAEILPLPLSIAKVEARECTSLKSFAQLSTIFFHNNGRNSSGLKIDLYGCHKLLVDMMLPSWEERNSMEQNQEDHFEARITGLIFLGKIIPNWFSYNREAHDNNWCEIDINGPHYWNQIEEIILCVVIGFRDRIMYQKRETEIFVGIHDGWHWNDLCNQRIRFDNLESDHVWLGCFVCPYNKGDISRFRFECDSERVVFRSVGVHLVKKHEENVRDHTGVLHEDVGAHFGKRRHDELDCNKESNLYAQRKRHSSTMGIRIPELENEDENPRESRLEDA